MTRFMQVVLVINVALAALVGGIAGGLLHAGPDGRVAAAEPILGRQDAALAIAFSVVVLFIVLRRFQSDPIWLLVPAVFTSALWIDAVYELAAGTGPVSANFPPVIIRAVLVACYAAGYVVLTRRAGGAAQASRSSMSPTAR